MRYYAEIRTQHPEYTDELYQNTFIDYRFHNFYDVLGVHKIKALRYREKDIEEATASAVLAQQITNECRKHFFPGKFYRLSDVKKMLQSIYQQLGVKRTAKATDIVEYIPTATKRQLTTTTTGKRELYYEIPL